MSFTDLYYLEYDDKDSSHSVKKLNLKLPYDLTECVIGSCNGLICINNHTFDHSTGSARYDLYICNPVTRECITLPELDRSKYFWNVNFMLCGFGYVASTNEYKVVRLFTFKDHTSQRKKEDTFAHIEVYTLGSGKGWRNAGTISNDVHYIARRNPVFANGFLYWDFGTERRIVGFDLANENYVEFGELWNMDFWRGVLGGHICSSDYNKDVRSSDVWSLKKKEDELFGWSKEFSFMDSYTTPLALTNSRTVLCYCDMKLYLYDLKSSFKMLEDLGRRMFNVVPHTNSFVSLKAFGEENTKAMESGKSAVEEARQMKQQ